MKTEEEAMLADSLVSWPVRWTRHGPELVGTLGGYNGPPYDVGKDIIELRENYGFRDLKPIIKHLEHKARMNRR